MPSFVFDHLDALASSDPVLQQRWGVRGFDADELVEALDGFALKIDVCSSEHVRKEEK